MKHMWHKITLVFGLSIFGMAAHATDENSGGWGDDDSSLGDVQCVCQCASNESTEKVAYRVGDELRYRWDATTLWTKKGSTEFVYRKVRREKQCARLEDRACQGYPSYRASRQREGLESGRHYFCRLSLIPEDQKDEGL